MCDDEWMWSTLLDKCNKIYKERGQGIRIPDTIAPDPVDVFDQTGRIKMCFVLSSIYVGYKSNPMHFENTCPFEKNVFTTGRIVSIEYDKFERQSLVRTVS